MDCTLLRSGYGEISFTCNLPNLKTTTLSQQLQRWMRHISPPWQLSYHIVGRNLDRYVDDELCAVDVSPGALCTYHGVPRRDPPRRAPIYIAQSPSCHISASRIWKIQLQIFRQQLMPSLWSRNPMNRFTSCNLSDVHEDSELVWTTPCEFSKLTGRRSNKNRLHQGHRERGLNPVAICSCAHASSFSATHHWSCTLKIIQVCEVHRISPFGGCKTMGGIFFIRRHRMLNKRRKSCKPGSAISWSSSWTMYFPRKKKIARKSFWRPQRVLKSTLKNCSGASY